MRRRKSSKPEVGCKRFRDKPGFQIDGGLAGCLQTEPGKTAKDKPSYDFEIRALGGAD